MTRAVSRPFTLNIASAAAATPLALAAASLAPGQCVRMDTPLIGQNMVFGSENANFLMWGVSGYYDPIRKEIGFIGKRDGTAPYHWLVYDEASDTWSNDRPLWSASETNGHGYDHNTIDPATGTVYFRPFNSGTIRTWNGSWSSLPARSGWNIVGGLSWFPGFGLVVNTGSTLDRYSDGAWSRITVAPTVDSYHDVSEYNAAANVLIFGGGNSAPMWKLTAAGVVSGITSPPGFSVGAGEDGQGILVSDPSAAKLIARKRATALWYEYDIPTDTWPALTQSTGDGSSPQNGTPNLTAGNTQLPDIAIPIPEYGVIMFIQYLGSGVTPAGVWLYKHS